MKGKALSESVLEGKKLIEDFKKSGMTAQCYANEISISYHKLMYWKKKIKKLFPENEETEKVAFAKVHIPTPTKRNPLEITVKTENYEIQIPAGISKEIFENIFGALNSICSK